MGVVYEAYDRELDELVALKTLRRAGDRWLGQFKREFRSLHDLAHANLVALGELFDGESEPFFTMELVRGVDFLSYVRGYQVRTRLVDAGPTTTGTRSPGAPRPDGAPDFLSHDSTPVQKHAATRAREQASEPVPYDEQRLRAALQQLALGIAALHDAGKVHRDIKPSNILVTASGRVVVLDFGLVAESGDGRSTDGDLVGTVAYMAPEQAAAGPATSSADWYSVGVILFEALTGRQPHVGATALEAMMNKQEHTPPPPSQLVDGVPSDLDSLCVDLLQLRAADRPRAPEILQRLGLGTSRVRAVTSPVSGASPITGPPFVGRTDQLSALHRAYDRVHDRALVYLVEGVSGVGKTQLVTQFLNQLTAHQPDAVVLSGRCYEREVVAYKAFDGIAESLARYLAHLPPDEVAAVMPARPTMLGRLFPVFKRVEAVAAARLVPDVPDPHDQRLRMFATLRELLLRIAQRRRLVWFIDDIQWTDADSLVLLQDLIAHADSLPVLVIATLRPVDSAERQELVREFERLAPTERLVVDELTRSEARELAELLLPGRDSRTLEAVAAGADGHPMFLHELARHAGSTRSSASNATFGEMLATRIAQLGDDVQTLLQVVCVSGGPVTQEVAALAAGLSSAEQIKAARTLGAAHLARTDGVRRTDRIVSYHDRVREHVTGLLGEERTQRLHERLALALEQTGAAEHDPRALVRHARAAGQHELAALYAQMSARHAVAALAFDQAAEFFATAIELGQHDDETLRGLRIELATALMHAGRGPEAASTFMLAADGASPAVRIDCQRQAADQWIITGHLQHGMEVLSSSLRDIGEPLAATPRSALARVLWNRTRLRFRGMRYTARREGQIPVEDLRHLDVLRAVAHGLAMVDNIRGADFNGRFLLRALRTGEPHRLVGAMATEAVFLASQGGRAGRRARRLFDKLVRLAEDIPDDPYVSTWLLLADGAACFFEGRFQPAFDALFAAETIFSDGPAGLTYERNNTRVFRVHTLRLLGRLHDQAVLIAELVRAGRQRGDRYLETTLELLRGQALLAVDDVDGAHASIDGATWSPPNEGFHLQHWYDLRSRVELGMYETAATATRDALAPQFAALRRSMLLRVKLVRADAISLYGRLLLAAAAEGHAGDDTRREVLAIARRLDRERVGYATVYGGLLRAGLACLGASETRDETITHLRHVVSVAADNHMALHLAAARNRLGTLLGGDEGKALRTEAAGYAAAEGIVDPNRMFEMIAPGIAKR